MLGKVVYTQTYNKLAATNQAINFSVADLASGVYFLNLKTEGGIVTRRFVKD